MALKEKGLAVEYISSTQTSPVKNKVLPTFSILHCVPHGILNFNKNYLLKGFICLNILKNYQIRCVHISKSFIFTIFKLHGFRIFKHRISNLYMAKLIKLGGMDTSYMILVGLME